MSVVLRAPRRRRRSGPAAVLALLAVGAFVLALTVTAALRPRTPAVAVASEQMAEGGGAAVHTGSPAETGDRATPPRLVLSPVPRLPTLHGVRVHRHVRHARHPVKPSRSATPAPTPVRTAAPVVTAAPTAVPVTPAPVHVAPPAPQKPTYVGKGFDSSG